MGISSLGIGSNVLTQDLIDKLKTQDEKVQIKPIETKISKTQEKQTALTTLTALMTTTKAYVKDFADEMTYLGRKATSSSSDVSMEVIGGTNAQNSTINVKQLAKNDIWESKGFAYSTSLVNTTGSSQTMTLTVGSSSTTSYSVAVKAGASLQDLADAINSTAGKKVTASIVNTGDASTPYRLVLKGKSDGAEGKITISDSAISTGFNTANTVTGSAISSSTGSLLSGDLVINGVSIPAVSLSSSDQDTNGASLIAAINNKTSETGVTATYDTSTNKISLSTGTNYTTIDVVTTANAESLSGLSTTRSQGTHLQTAQDAKFTYNGMSMTRSSNTISDLAVGITFTINAANSKDISLSVKQDLGEISTMATQFVDAYNTMQSQLTALTKYTKGATSQGIFVGVSEIGEIESKIMSSFSESVTVGGKSASLMDYGFSVDKNGKMSVDIVAFNKKLNEDPTTLEKIFRGETTYTDASYTGKRSATTSTTTSAIGDIIINGVALPAVTTSSSNTSVQNAQLYADAINKLKTETGVSASVTTDGALKLTTSNGGKIQLQTTTNGATYSGLSSSATTATALAKAMVAIGSSKTSEGAFTLVNKTFDALLNTKSTGSLDLYEDELSDDLTRYNEQKTKTQERIESNYEIMTKRFQLYDAMIAQMTQKSSSLTMMINQAMNS